MMRNYSQCDSHNVVFSGNPASYGKGRGIDPHFKTLVLLHETILYLGDIIINLINICGSFVDNHILNKTFI